ncbi:hypothetical protein M409DRAFT_25296 [Zasmidium cellare ATCC 36951]|uniref:2EXR domain-containing protein n=1 Tax=Zasmidium cellare ATCC 36951 TaxID=1080233 RepID=A0A6A6CFG7_ZASCE|nr:uncharacterized protein M409DRAFT_25296 [Zasmidium cellare ATCC 36951]KAF2164419.1 hypothetical protein M409DRAFT_25296 [Zasmidium cellare ATCC 36951]
MESSPFSKLPPELRLTIFEYALAFPQPLQIPSTTPSNPKHPTALPQTSRQLHLETSHLLYTLNTIHLTTPSHLPSFLDTISPRDTSHLRSLCISIPSSAGNFGQDIHYFRSVVQRIAREIRGRLPRACRVVVWPVLLVDRRQYSKEEFEGLMEVLEVHVRDVEGSLRRAVGRVGERMRGEERRGVWRDLFWARRLFGEFLREKEEGMRGDRDGREGGDGDGEQMKGEDEVGVEKVDGNCSLLLDA